MCMDNYTNIHKGKSRKNRGFTLIELIVVILILGIVAAVAVPRIFLMLDHVKELKFYSDMDGLKKATVTAYDQNPALKTLGSGSAREEAVAQEIADLLASTVESPSYQWYNIASIDVPYASKWKISVNDHGAYIHAYHVKMDKGIEIAQKMGYGEPTAKNADPPNLNAYWDGKSGDVIHLMIALIRFD